MQTSGAGKCGSHGIVLRRMIYLCIQVLQDWVVFRGAPLIPANVRQRGVDLQNALPDILCVVQVALEGDISRKAAMASLAKGTLPSVRQPAERAKL